jgi:predicted nucleic acid-binding protein
MDLILDTSAYSRLKVGDAQAIALAAQADRLLLPPAVAAELLYGFKNGTKESLNREVLERFLSQPNVGQLAATFQTAGYYAKLAWHAKCSGRALSANDIWICASALEHNASLLTYDKDFEVFAGLFGQRLHIADTSA